MHNYCTPSWRNLLFSYRKSISEYASCYNMLLRNHIYCMWCENNAAFRHLCRWYSLHFLLINFSCNCPCDSDLLLTVLVIAPLFFCFCCPSPLYFSLLFLYVDRKHFNLKWGLILCHVCFHVYLWVLRCKCGLMLHTSTRLLTYCICKIV